ncbi:LapA family protein [Virgibacillus halodenitrificans]|uniref:Lipopolysaccharide assembly protein A domain-containing protein n=1 Tax=Virgibacillus halodenitrificans TaxID=1482 RepID=A0AAC9NL14_VIRHA|nr:lipopolysaccharide assembly protein LapA domain-containing protein [Virgibacillus halodenitrificans]APC48161.1 hypothetical protein BME96_08220 [Virgibacillus halodenitrificans]MYL47597.1 DUF1049 domain-containing protein [Virgibacillus halodenitrificans]
MKGQSYVILAIVFIIVVAIFAVSNVEAVDVNYIFWTGNSPLILVILFSVLMGGIITAAVGAVKVFRLQRELKRYKHENNLMNKKLQENGVSLEKKDKHSKGHEDSTTK